MGFTRITPWLLSLAVVNAVTVAAETIHYREVEPVVSFNSVLELPTGEPSSIHTYGEAASQFAQLWLPGNTLTLAPRPAPLVIFIHGGCWLSAYSIGHSHALATALAQSGYAVWNIEYRRVGETGGGWPGSLEDIQAAIALLYQLQPAGVDFNRVAIAGHSAGGHLALLAADQAANAIPAIGLAPIIDIAEYAGGDGSCNGAAIQFMGGKPKDRPTAYTQASPTVPLAQGHIALMGSKDSIVPANSAYLPAGMLTWPAAEYFDWIHPGTHAFEIFQQQLQGALQ